MARMLLNYYRQISMSSYNKTPVSRTILTERKKKSRIKFLRINFFVTRELQIGTTLWYFYVPNTMTKSKTSNAGNDMEQK